MKVLLIFLALSALPSKEVLNYDVYLGPIYAGNMRLTLLETEFEGRPCYRLRSVLNSVESLSWLFNLNDTLYSYVTRDSFKVLYTEKRIHETGYDTVVRVDYDWEAGLIRYEDDSTYELKPGTLDLVSIYYYFRINPLGAGDSTRVILHADGKTEEALVRAVRETRVRSQASQEGSFLCTMLTSEVAGKASFGSGGQLAFYLSNDSLQMPVLIKTLMKFGSIDARLGWDWRRW